MAENFFDFREKQLGERAKARAAKQAAAPVVKATAGKEMLSVSQLTHVIEHAIKTGVPSTVLVQGELSNVNMHRGSGHLYFTMKDANACIDCVMWKSDLARLKFEPSEGDDVLVTGSIGVYATKGRYQVYARNIEPMGRGALEVAYRQLYEKLEREGLFAPERKRPLPRYPLKIALVTSRDGAALQDMLKVLRRFPFLNLRLRHVPVQGDGSAEKIAGQIDSLGRESAAARPEVILLGRGGGSIEDLWEFNEEILARAIVNSSVPVVTGIGHEVDTAIADLVADHHAHTPTEAAQVVTAFWRTVEDELALHAMRLHRALIAVAADAKQRLMLVERHEVFRRPLERINQLRQRLDDRQRQLVQTLRDRVHRSARALDSRDARLKRYHPRHAVRLIDQKLCALQLRLQTTMEGAAKRLAMRVAAADGKLQALSPQAVLKRGYSITTMKKGGALVRSIDDVKPGDVLRTRVSDGEIESTVEDGRQPKLFE